MITLIGDTHGKFDRYLSIAQNSEYSIQLGDFGFSSSYNNLAYCGLDPSRHKVIPGNHCIYPECLHSPFCLGDFGPASLAGTSFFFIRGGLSIDRTYRVGEWTTGGPKTWWDQEELSFAQMLQVIDSYKEARPDIVLTHVPPAVINDRIYPDDKMLVRYGFSEGFRESTALLGNELLKIHRPKLWVGAHHHKSYTIQIGETKFVGLAELEVAMLEDLLG